jgi:hypothetical protein
MKHRILIQILPMINEIDYLERTLLFLKQNCINIDRSKYHIILDVTLPISDYLIDWENSILKQDFFIDKFNHLKNYTDCFDEVYFNVDDKIKGCVDYCVSNVYKYNDIDAAIWLDTDIIFNNFTLHLVLESFSEIFKNQDNFIITPEYIRLWDGSWDVVTNEYFNQFYHGYEKTNDSILDVSSLYGDVSLEPLDNNRFKFGGSWFTLFSKKLLDYIDFPKDLEGYSPIDTFIMNFCSQMPNVTQYKVKGLVVCEDYKHTNKSLYQNYVKTINRKEDPLYSLTWNKMEKHLIDKLKL